MEKCIFCERQDIILENRLAWVKYDKNVIRNVPA
jgi:hypothetical protein